MALPFDLSRFTQAHQQDYPTALAEIRRGRKKSHWMWYIFPQIDGLGRSPTAQFYAIRSIDEAKAFLADPLLGRNLLEISQALLELDTCDAREIFWSPDDLKLRSCMTLFACASGNHPVFLQVLDKFFGGEMDPRTLQLIQH